MSEILISNVTTIDLNGTGTFDTITQAFAKRLDEQWSESRLRGTEYANVYLGLMNTAMQQAIAFELGKQEAAAQADLIIAQKNKVVKETALLDLEELKLAAELALINAQVTLAGKGVEKIIAEIALMDRSLINEELKGLILIEERLKIIAETARINSEKLGVDQATTNAQITATNLLRNQEKTEAETELLRTKKFTEQAQYVDVVNGEPVVGIIGKQKNLYQAQTDGFKRDAEQKLAKIMSDSWVARRSTDEAENPAGTGLTNVEINAVMAKARAGIGL